MIPWYDSPNVMAYYSDDVFSDSSISLRRFLIPAVLVSLLIHGGLFYGLSKKTLENFAASDRPRLVPRVFSVNRLQVDQKLLEPDGKPTGTPGSKTADPGSVKNLSQFDGTFEDDMKEFRATPEVSSPEVPDIKEKPSVDTQASRTAAAKAKAESALALDKELSDVRQQLMNDKPTVATRPKIASGNKNNPGKTENQDAGDSAIAGNSGIPSGFSNLDEILSGSGRVGNGTAPILMPTDLLFDYDSANLRAGATASLQKLGRLIQRNPQAVFRVEGHTDSFGSDEYNLDLSQRRAETVKGWLVQNMGIDPGRIQTQGFGKSRLIVPGDRTVEEQQLNRRVEIVIRSRS
jgi:outer membrane protein OmpA-like peptidoglycan-associated protein